ncbi:hypothetical protein KC315_g9250 [Hortaea werneckii]|nr:hypothetical protein KC315_g9250 [Hortaea werneckii]
MMRNRNNTSEHDVSRGQHDLDGDAHASGTDAATSRPPAYSSVGEPSIIDSDQDARDYTQIDPDADGQPINVLTELPCVLEPSRKATLLCRSGSLDEGHLVEFPLSAFAATILIDAGEIWQTQLTPIPGSCGNSVDEQASPLLLQSSRNGEEYQFYRPVEPLTGVLAACAQAFGSVAKGFASMPKEVSKQSRSPSYPDAITAPAHQDQTAYHSKDEQRRYRYASAASLGVGKTVGYVTLGAVRLPFLVTLNVARGFDNLPALYKDPTYRTPDHITDTRSGAVSAGKAFAFGLYDGLTGVFTQPYTEVAKGKGAGKKAAGFCKGLGMGIAGLAFKPTAGYYGLVGYTYEGIEKDIRKWSRRTRSEGGDQGLIKMGTLVTTQQVLEDARPEFEKTGPDVRRVLVKSWRELQGRN